MSTIRIYTVPKVLDQPTLTAIAHIAGGYTAYRAVGGWIDPNNTLITEDAMILELLNIEEPQTQLVIKFIEAHAFSLGEQAIAYVLNDDTAVFQFLQDTP